MKKTRNVAALKNMSTDIGEHVLLMQIKHLVFMDISAEPKKATNDTKKAVEKGQSAAAQPQRIKNRLNKRRAHV